MSFVTAKTYFRVPSCIILMATLAATLICQASAAEMKAGVARVDITPPLGMKLWGYFDRLKGAEGILDPLYARVLVLETGDQRLAYVDLDLGRSFGPVSLDNLRAAVKKSSGIDNLIVQATHTHSGPVIMDVYPDGTPAWETGALVKIEDAIHDASDHAAPVRLGVGYGVAYIGYNRRLVNADGSISMVWSNTTRTPTWPVDPTIAILRIDRMNGDPLAILVNYAAHPVIFSNDNLRYSADFPGVMCKVVEQAFGGKPMAFFVQGAPGDINVFDAGTPINLDAAGRRDWTGETLGKAAASAAQQIQTRNDADSSIDFKEDLVPFKLRWDAEKFHKISMDEMGPDIFKIYSPPIVPVMELPVTTALIDRKIAIVGMPGEPFVDFQTDLRARCPVQHCFVLGYTNGYYGYFPTIKAASEGGYGAVSGTTWVEVGAGEQMVNRGLVNLYKMLGSLQDVPNAKWKSLPEEP